jgi:type I restriction enzyme R subunit
MLTLPGAREILENLHGAAQIGLTVTPKETEYISNMTTLQSPSTPTASSRGIGRDGFWVSVQRYT